MDRRNKSLRNILYEHSFNTFVWLPCIAGIMGIMSIMLSIMGIMGIMGIKGGLASVAPGELTEPEMSLLTEKSASQ